MTTTSPAPATSLDGLQRRRAVIGTGTAVTVALLLLGGCGGDDDSASTTTAPVVVTIAPTTVAITTPPTTAAPTTTTTTLVTQGAKLIVANASGINGAAGRMTDALAVAGFSTGTATNSTESQLSTTKIYFDPANPDAEAVANSVKAVLGGGAIEVLELVTPAPVESGEVGDASIVVAIGNDVADKTLAELQGGGTTDTTDTTDTSTPDTTDG